jgi:hypothetical protein
MNAPPQQMMFMSPPPPQQLCSPPPQRPVDNSKTVWYESFEQLFKQFAETWMLRQIENDDQEPVKGDPGWMSDTCTAKVRFICETDTCPNQWTSMRGVVNYWYTMTPRPYTFADGRQVVAHQLIFRAQGQRCAKCQNAKLQAPLWYEREVKKMVVTMFESVVRDVYNPRVMRSPNYWIPEKMDPQVRLQEQNNQVSNDCKTENNKTEVLDAVANRLVAVAVAD